jgi:GNAT superfamily N-acetyltransferase
MSDALHVQAVPAADWPSLAAFIFAHNRASGDVRCLHSNAGEDEAAHADELRSLPPGEACWCAARAGGVLVGVAGAEYDATLGRAWLRGPLVAAGHDYPGVAERLLPALCAQLPATIVVHDAFVCAGCTDAIELFRRQGFSNESTHVEYSVRPPVAEVAVPPGVRLAAPDPRWRAAIGALHESEFRSPHVAATELFEPDAAGHFTRIALVDEVPSGYVRAHFDRQWQEGYVDFIAVSPAARRRGAGRALLQAALQWSFGQAGARAVALTMREDRASAGALYEAAGFQRVRTGIALRRNLGR